MDFETIVIGNDITALLYAYLHGYIFFPVDYEPSDDNGYNIYDIGVIEKDFTKLVNVNNEVIPIICMFGELERYLIFLMSMSGKIINSNFKKVLLKNNSATFSGPYSKLDISFDECHVVNPKFNWGNFESFDFQLPETDKKLIKDKFTIEPSIATNIDIIKNNNRTIHFTEARSNKTSYRSNGIHYTEVLAEELESFHNSEIYTKYQISNLITNELNRLTFTDSRINIDQRLIFDLEPVKINDTKRIKFLCQEREDLLVALQQRGSLLISGSAGMIRKFQLERISSQSRRQY